MRVEEILDILYDAAREPLGVVVWSNDANTFRTRCSLARRDARDPALAKLEFRTSPFPEGQLMIVNGDKVAKSPNRVKLALAEELDI